MIFKYQRKPNIFAMFFMVILSVLVSCGGLESNGLICGFVCGRVGIFCILHLMYLCIKKIYFCACINLS